MDRGDTDFVSNRAERDFPLPGTRYERWHLDAGTGVLSLTESQAAASVRYEATFGQAIFETTFQQETEITGYMKLRLWVQAEGATDMDLFVAVQKIDETGVVPTMALRRPHPG